MTSFPNATILKKIPKFLSRHHPDSSKAFLKSKFSRVRSNNLLQIHFHFVNCNRIFDTKLFHVLQPIIESIKVLLSRRQKNISKPNEAPGLSVQLEIVFHRAHFAKVFRELKLVLLLHNQFPCHLKSFHHSFYVA